VTLLVSGLTAGCGDEEHEKIDVQIASGALRVSFTRPCEVAFLRLTAVDPATGLASPSPWWEIRATAGAAVLDAVTPGTPPAGFEELTDATAGAVPAALDLTVKHGQVFAARIDTAVLTDGALHTVELREVMSELRPAARARCYRS
jgi:hypothetical protein